MSKIVSRPASFYKKFVSLAVMYVLTVSVLFTTVFQVMTSYRLCLQKIGLGQFENQNVSRPNHDFCNFVVDFKEFFVGEGHV